jgi:ATP-dependent DNA helicase RecG
LLPTALRARRLLKLHAGRRDRELVELAREAAFEIVDGDPNLSRHPLLLDELDLLFTDEDEGFLTKS